VSGDEEGSSRVTRRPSSVVLVCVALAVLFGSGVWRLTVGSPGHGRDDSASLVDQSARRAASLPAVSDQSPGQGGQTRYDRLAAVDWNAMHYPMKCGTGRTGGTKVMAAEFADLDRDRAADAVVLVRCAAGGDAQPAGLFVYSGNQARPRLLATLLRPSDGVVAGHVKVTGVTIKVSGFAYSSGAVPRCCPDETIEACWRWTGSEFTRVG
jgi:hypothetical protein